MAWILTRLLAVALAVSCPVTIIVGATALAQTAVQPADAQTLTQLLSEASK